MGILDTILAPFGASGAQVTQNVTAQQPTTSGGQTYASAPQAQQPAVAQPVSVNSLVSGATSFVQSNIVSPAISTIQPIISQAPSFIEKAAPALVPPVAIAAGATSILFPQQQVPVSKYQAADYGSPIIPQQPQFVSPPLTQYDVAASRAVEERPGYTPVTELGGTSTQQAMGGYKMFQQSIALMGGTVAPSEMQVGRVLEAQRIASPTTREQQFYSGELSKWAENMVELGSAYHSVGATANVPIPASRYEYQADLGVEFLKGAPTKPSEFFSPVSGEMAAVLPGGKGLQESAWQVAKTGEVSKVSYSPAVEKLISAQGVYGPYGKLWGGPEYKEKGFNAPQYPGITSGFGRATTIEKVASSGAISPISQSMGVPAVTEPAKASAFGTAFGSAFALTYGASKFIKGAITGFTPTVPTTQEKRNVTIATQEIAIPEQTTVTGGNVTITDLGKWLDINKGNVSAYDSAQVERYNKVVDIYNEMQKQNPIITTVTGGKQTVTTTTTTTATQGGEQAFLSGIYKTVGIPSFDAKGIMGFAGGVVGAAVSEAGKGVSGIASVASKYPVVGGFVGATATPMAEFFGAETGAVTATELAAANPIILGAGIGIIGAVKAEQFGVLGVTGPTEGLSVRTIGEQVGLGAFRAGQATGTALVAARTQLTVGQYDAGIKAKELWEDVGGVIGVPGAYQMPKITDVIESPAFQAPGEGYKQIVSLPGQGAGTLIGLPGIGRGLIAKTSEAIGQGFPGFGSVIEMPKSTITPEDVIMPFVGGATIAERAVAQPTVVSERAIFDLSVSSEAKSTAATREAVVSEFGVSTYAAKVAAMSPALTVGVSTPFWWTKSTAATRSLEDTFTASQFGVQSVSRYTEMTRATESAATASSATTSNINRVIDKMTKQVQQTQYTTDISPRGKTTPETDIRGKIGWLPRFDFGGGGSLGGGRKRSKNFLEVFRMGLDIAAYGGMRTPKSPLPKLKGVPGLIQKKQTSPSAFKRKRKRS